MTADHNQQDLEALWERSKRKVLKDLDREFIDKVNEEFLSKLDNATDEQVAKAIKAVNEYTRAQVGK